jgi:Trypsin
MMLKRTLVGCAVGAMLCMPSGCAVEATSSGELAEDTTAVIEPIIGGTETTAYPEAALLSMRSAAGASYACSAVLIAPSVVLTAGHCVDGMVSWSVSVSGAHGSAASATRGETFDWHENGAATVNPSHHDIGLVYLDRPIQIPAFPVLATAAVSDKTQVVDLGRIDNAMLTNSFYKAPVTVSDAAPIGYPFDYYGVDVIEHGDSGGPVFLPSTHTIVAVNSGAGTGVEVLARVDLLSAWIAQRIATMGPAPEAGAGAVDGGADDAQRPPEAGPIADANVRSDAPGAETSVPTPAPGDSGTRPEAKGACVSEKEPNDVVASANSVSDSECASLGTAADADWYVLVAAPGTTRIQLVATADASLAVGYLTPQRTCSIVIPAAAGAVAATITVGAQAAPTSVCASVTSRGHKIQTYKLAVLRRP